MTQTLTPRNIPTYYTVSESDLVSWKCDTTLSLLPVSSWGELNLLIRAYVGKDKGNTTAKTALNILTNSFKKIGDNTQYAALSTFAHRLESAARTTKYKTKFLELYSFQLELISEKEKLSRQRDLTNCSIAILTEKRVKRKADQSIGEEEHRDNDYQEQKIQKASPESTPNDDTRSIPQTPPTSISSIINNDGIRLHQRYKQGSAMDIDELKRMSSGLSSILDVIDGSPQGQKAVIGEENWHRLQKKYCAKYKIEPLNLLPVLDETLVILSKMCDKRKVEEAREYLDNVIDNTSNEELKRSLKVLTCAFEIFIEQDFLFDKTIANSLSENDYVCGVWVPLLKKCLYIHDNKVRAQIGETSNPYTSSKKKEIYGSKVNGFKVDIRFVTDINSKPFDVGAAEAAKKDPVTEKISTDEGKLLREGKDILDKLLKTVLVAGNSPQVTGWMVQLSGLHGYIYSIHLCSPGLYVAVPQSPIEFPTSANLFSSFTSTVKWLLTLCKKLNDSAKDARNAIHYLNHDPHTIADDLNLSKDIVTTPDFMSWIRPSYYTPPNKDRSISVIPPELLQLNLTYSDAMSLVQQYLNDDHDAVDNEDDDINDSTVHVTGWKKVADGRYFNVYSKTYRDENPL